MIGMLSAAMCALATLGAPLRAPAVTASAHLVQAGRGPTTAQDVPARRFGFRTYGADQGLDNAVAYALLQDAEGFLWVGSDDGLYRYDGRRFQRFGTADGLPASTVRVLAGGRDGVPLWVGTSRGLARRDRARAVGVRPEDGVPEGVITGLAIGRGRIWVANPSGLFHQIGPHRFEAAPGWPGGPAGATWADPDGTVVVAQKSELLVLSPDGVWTRFGSAHGLGVARIDAVVRDASGTLWARSRRKLWSRRRDQVRFEEERVPPDNSEDGHLSLDASGSVWVASEVGALHREGSAWRTVGPQEGLPEGSVRAVLQDREGSLWFAATGIHQQLGRGLWRILSRRDGLPGDVVWTEWRDPQGLLWVGTDRGLARALPGGRGFRVVPETADHNIRAISPARDGLWVGGSPAELLRLDLHTKRVERFGAPDGVAGTKLLIIRFDREGTMWIGTEGAGLLRRGPDVAGRPHFERVELPGGVPNERIAFIQEDGDGRLWASGERGLLVREHGAWRRFTAADGLRDSWVAYVLVRRSGEVCAAYVEPLGLTCFRYGPAGVSNLHHLGQAQGLVSSKIYLLGEDFAGRLWVGTGRGVDILSDRGVEHFTEQQGLPGDDMAAMSFLAEPDGGVWVGSSRGLGWFDSAAYNPGSARLQPAFVDLELGNRSYPPDGPTPSVDRDSRTFEARYASLSFLDNAHALYEIQLRPEDAAPRETRSTEARYTSLAPGMHVFQVRARLPSGPFSEPILFAFEVRPAWWQTLWARALALLVSLLLLGVALSWRARALRERSARQALARSELGFRKLIEASPDAILVHRDGALVYVNPSAVSALGWSRSEELVGVPVLSLIHPDDRASVASRLIDVGQKSEPAPLREERLLRRDGAVRTFEIAALSAEFDGAPCVLMVARDVSERKQLEARLQLSDRMASVGTLASGVAHEINNPLAYVKVNLDWSLETLSSAPEGIPASQIPALTESLRDAADGAERVRKIVGGLRAFAGSARDADRDVTLAEVFESALKLVANEVRHRAQVVRAFAPAPVVHVDPSRLTQVFVNLIVNAAQAIPEGRAEENTIRLITRTDESGRAVAEVEDTGKGIPREIIGRIFDPFFTTKDVGAGTGLGLSICHGIVTAMEGEISVVSTPGAGTTFRVALPPAGPRQAEAPAPAPAPEPPPARRGRVWVVDDESLVGAAIRRVLGREHDVRVFEQADEVVARVERGDAFDLLLCDLMMPSCSGAELHARIRSLAPGLAARMAFMTGGAFTSESQAFAASLSRTPLEKPFRNEDLRALVTEMLPPD